MSVRMSLIDAVLYRGTAGSTAGTLINTVGDVSLTIKKGESKISSRASRWALVKAGLKEAEIQFSIIDDSADTNLTALISAFINDTPLAFLIKDAVAGHGLDADFEVLTMDRDEKLEDAIGYKFTIKPTYVSRYPVWV